MQEIQNNFESKISVKIEANSRGYTTSIHVYEGVTQKQINKTVEMAIYAHQRLQNRLSDISKEAEVISK